MNISANASQTRLTAQQWLADQNDGTRKIESGRDFQGLELLNNACNGLMRTIAGEQKKSMKQRYKKSKDWMSLLGWRPQDSGV